MDFTPLPKAKSASVTDGDFTAQKLDIFDLNNAFKTVLELYCCEKAP